MASSSAPDTPDDIPVKIRVKLIEQLKRALFDAGFSLFGGAVRDEIAGDVPKDLDVLLSESSFHRGSSEKSLKDERVDKLKTELAGQFEIRPISDDDPNYSFSVNQYNCVSVKYPKFSIKLDIVPGGLFGRNLDCDVNSLIRGGRGDH